MTISALPATFSPAPAEATFEMKKTARSRVTRYGSFALAGAIALALAACTGGAGLGTSIGPVDHSCPNGNNCGGGRSG
jgi:hypothetical protein